MISAGVPLALLQSNCSARTTGLFRRRGAVDTRSRRAQRDTPIEARNAEDGETGIEHRTVAQPGKHASRYRQTRLIHDYSPRN